MVCSFAILRPRGSQCCCGCFKLLRSRIFGDIMPDGSCHALFEMSPSLVGSEVDTAQEPVCVLHVSVHAGDEGRLLEVRSVRRCVDTVDEYVVIAFDIGEEVLEVLHLVASDIGFEGHFKSSWVLIGALFIKRQEIAFFIGPHR